VKFCQFVASLYPRMFTNYDRFIILFNIVALFFSRSTYRFTVSISFEF